MKDDKPDLFNELQRKAREHTEKYGPINSLYELYALLKQHLDLIWDYTKNDAFHAITGEIKNLVAIALNGLELKNKSKGGYVTDKTPLRSADDYTVPKRTVKEVDKLFDNYMKDLKEALEKDIPSPHLDKKEYKTVGINNHIKVREETDWSDKTRISDDITKRLKQVSEYHEEVVKYNVEANKWGNLYQGKPLSWAKSTCRPSVRKKYPENIMRIWSGVLNFINDSFKKPEEPEEKQPTDPIPKNMTGISEKLLKIIKFADEIGIKIMFFDYVNCDTTLCQADVDAFIEKLEAEKTEDHTDSIIYNTKGMPHWKG